jgi:DNA-binding MarR family transcriptional regulator
VLPVTTRAETPTLGFLVWRLSMKWRAAADRALAPVGLTHAQFAVLASLFGMERAGHRPIQRQLADQVGLEPVYVSRLVRALERSGLVGRTGDPTDTRAMQLRLTDQGRELAVRAVGIVADLQEQLTAPLGGTGSERSRALARELRELLAAPGAPMAGPADPHHSRHPHPPAPEGAPR